MVTDLGCQQDLVDWPAAKRGVRYVDAAERVDELARSRAVDDVVLVVVVGEDREERDADAVLRSEPMPA